MRVTTYLLLVLALAAVALLLALALAALPLRSKNPKVAVAGEALSHGGVVLLLIVGACYVLPQFMLIVDEFGLDPPTSTLIWESVGKALLNRPIRFLRILVFLLFAEVTLFGCLFGQDQTRKLARWFSGLVTVLLAVATITLLAGLFLPFARLIEGLT